MYQIKRFLSLAILLNTASLAAPQEIEIQGKVDLTTGRGQDARKLWNMGGMIRGIEMKGRTLYVDIGNPEAIGTEPWKRDLRQSGAGLISTRLDKDGNYKLKLPTPKRLQDYTNWVPEFCQATINDSGAQQGQVAEVTIHISGKDIMDGSGIHLLNLNPSPSTMKQRWNAGRLIYSDAPLSINRVINCRDSLTQSWYEREVIRMELQSGWNIVRSEVVIRNSNLQFITTSKPASNVVDWQLVTGSIDED